jgi:prepilin-type N-terminal cleavage/methylation domain-containing protein
MRRSGGRRQSMWTSNNLKPPAPGSRRHQKKGKLMRIETSRRGGFTLVEIMIVVAIIGLLAAIAIPNFVKARSLSQKSACIENLRQIFGAKATWALENKKTPSDTPAKTDLYGASQYIRDEPECPASGLYNLQPVDTKPTCNIGGHTL